MRSRIVGNFGKKFERDAAAEVEMIDYVDDSHTGNTELGKDFVSRESLANQR